MLTQLLIETLFLPLLIGVLAYFAFGQRAGSLSLAYAFVVLLAVAATQVILEGMPGWPPVSSKQKAPYVLAAASILFLVWPAYWPRLKPALNGVVFWVASLAPMVWIGFNVMPRKPVETLSIVVMATSLAVAGVILEGKAGGRAPANRVAGLSASAFAHLALAIAAAFGAYVGMAQINGAAAAVVGGSALLAILLAFIGRPGSHMQTSTVYGLNWLLVVYAGITVLFGPHVSIWAVLLASLCPWVPVVLLRSTRPVFANAGGVSHLVASCLAGIPAVISIAVSAATFLSSSSGH